MLDIFHICPSPLIDFTELGWSCKDDGPASITEEVKDLPARRPIRRSSIQAPPPVGFSFASVASGLLFSLIFAVVVFLIWSLVFTLTSLPDKYMTYAAYGTSFVAVLLGARRATRKAGGKGLVHGGLVGVLYALVLFAVASLTTDAPLMTMISNWGRPLGDIIAGILGGIWGSGSR